MTIKLLLEVIQWPDMLVKTGKCISVEDGVKITCIDEMLAM